MEALPNTCIYTIACYAPVLCLVKKEWNRLFQRNFCKFHPDQFRPFNKPCKICGFVRRLKPDEQLRLWQTHRAAASRPKKRIRRRRSQNSFIPSLLMYGVS